VKRAGPVLLVALVALAAACAPSRSPSDQPSSIAQIHAGACASCHRRVEPGTRSRAELEVALARHHRRVHLTDTEWQAMVDYLAKPPSEARATP
jgi:hypothetical protein